MKVGVTGASGHLGNVVCRTLLERGYEVKAMFRSDSRAIEDLKIEKVQGDILVQEDINRFVEGCDAIIHSAAFISIHGDPNGLVHKTNTIGPENVVKAVEKFGVKKLIHVSSTHAVKEKPYDKPFDEMRPYKEKGDFAYDYSKSCGEQIVLKAVEEGRINAIVVRPSAITGPFDFKPSELGKALSDFYHRKIPILPTGGYNFVDVRDISEAIVNGIESDKNGEVYLLSGTYYTIKELAEKINCVTGVKTPKRVMSFGVMKLLLPFIKFYGWIRKSAPVYTIESISALKEGHRNMDNSKAKRDLGLQCRDIETTLQDYYQWMTDER